MAGNANFESEFIQLSGVPPSRRKFFKLSFKFKYSVVANFETIFIAESTFSTLWNMRRNDYIGLPHYFSRIVKKPWMEDHSAYAWCSCRATKTMVPLMYSTFHYLLMWNKHFTCVVFSSNFLNFSSFVFKFVLFNYFSVYDVFHTLRRMLFCSCVYSVFFLCNFKKIGKLPLLESVFLNVYRICLS